MNSFCCLFYIQFFGHDDSISICFVCCVHCNIRLVTMVALPLTRCRHHTTGQLVLVPTVICEDFRCCCCCCIGDDYWKHNHYHCRHWFSQYILNGCIQINLSEAERRSGCDLGFAYCCSYLSEWGMILSVNRPVSVESYVTSGST